MRIAGLALACVSFLTPAAAWAEVPPLAGVGVEGAPSPEAAAAFVDGVVGAAQHQGSTPGTCVTPECLATVVTAGGHPRGLAVTVRIEGELRDRFVMAAVIVDDRGRALRRRSETCEPCNLAEAVTRARQLVAAVSDAASDDAVAVTIATAPVRAPVSVDGVDRGRAPWSGELPAGPHTVVAGSVTRELFVEASAEPVAITIDVPVAPRPRNLLRFAPYALAGVGVLALGTGVYLASVDGDPDCAHPRCPEIRDTATGGWLLIGTGAVALGAAGYLYWRERGRERAVLAVVPTRGGAAAVATGRF